MGLWFVAYRLRIYGSLQIIDTIRTENALEKRVDDLELCFGVLFSAKTEFGRAKEHWASEMNEFQNYYNRNKHEGI